MGNPEILATLGTQAEINFGENRIGYKERESRGTANTGRNKS